MLSRGDPKTTTEAKARITNALLGFVIIFFAYWVVRLIGLIFGLRAVTGFFG